MEFYQLISKVFDEDLHFFIPLITEIEFNRIILFLRVTT
jgi:hypothetical protein